MLKNRNERVRRWSRDSVKYMRAYKYNIIGDPAFFPPVINSLMHEL
jgi:hypothetical protein